MKMLTRSVMLVALVVAMSGCYHARITTGLTPSTQVIDKPFATGWIYGLVPPSPVNAAEECTNGVAIVETELSFVNQLVSAITFGIFTPMHIKVTCATGGRAALDGQEIHSVNIQPNHTEADVIAAFDEAATLAVEAQSPVLVRFQ